MPSAALLYWRSVRTRRLARLRAAHLAFRASGRGRKFDTEELNHALILRLATEFQGFARDLHDEAVVGLARDLTHDPVAFTALQSPYTVNRRLDRGGADPASLSADFGLFGFELWVELDRRYPRRGPAWRKKLTLLTTARNGIAHDDHNKIARVCALGWPMTLRSVERWHSALDGLVTGIDRTVEDQLRLTFGVRSW